MGHFHHIVLFTVRDAADVDGVLAALAAARPTEGLVAWDVQRSLDERKGPVVAQVSAFTSADAFQAWRDSDAHRTAAEHLRTVADWIVADWEAP